MNDTVFPDAHWIWTSNSRPNDYVVFVRTVPWRDSRAPLQVTIIASSHYELYINGDFVGRGPVFGDPQWRLYDELTYTPSSYTDSLHIVIVAHNSIGIPILAQRPAPGGIRASFSGDGLSLGTDASWHCLPLTMWAQEVPKRGWALDYCEDYDANLEPVGWQEKRFSPAVLVDWPQAVLLLEMENEDATYQSRPTPYLQHSLVVPVTFTAYRADGFGAEKIGDVSEYCDTEPLSLVAQNVPYTAEAIASCLSEGENAFTFDLGAEYIGHYTIEIEAPSGITIDVSGAELLREGRPWIVRKGTRFSVRYRTRAGRQRFRSFAWSGLRYLHVVLRGNTSEVDFLSAGCYQRGVPLRYSGTFSTDDETLRRIFDLCQRTLQVGTQEHLIDCPTREQAQYWGDAVFIAQSLWRGFDEPSYLCWFLDAFLQVPFTHEGQISSVYPGSHAVFPDYSLIPLLGQRFHRENTGNFYRVTETCEKALRLKAWYDERAGEDGLVRTILPPKPGEPTPPYIVFIDHPGLGWHDFPHRGIDRGEISAPLNLFYYGWLTILAEMLQEAGRATESEAIVEQAERLGEAIRATFFDGMVFHDACHSDGTSVSEGASWQVNALAVYFGLSRGEEATRLLGTMLETYESACRCSPYFHFYFLPALRAAGKEAEAITLIKREWQTMLDGNATTTWEGFTGDDKDSLCHPWSTAPFLYLLS